jgi:outer membrane protein
MSKIGMASAAAALAMVMGATPALAEDGVRGKLAGDFVVGLGAIGVLPANDGGRVDTIGGRPRASNSASPQLDFSYFFTPNLALNLILATTQHDLVARGTALGDVQLGSVWALPPTLTLQYHPLPAARFSPYVGVGLNYTAFYGYSHGGGSPVVRGVAVNNSVGAALNAGLDVEISGPWGLNVDVKKIFMSPNAAVGTTLGVKLHARTEINPLVVGMSVRYRFSL